MSEMTEERLQQIQSMANATRADNMSPWWLRDTLVDVCAALRQAWQERDALSQVCSELCEANNEDAKHFSTFRDAFLGHVRVLPDGAIGVSVDDVLAENERLRAECERLASEVADRALMSDCDGDGELPDGQVSETWADGLQAQLDEARAEVGRLRAEREAIQNDQRALTCAFCGHIYPPGTPTANHQALYEHVAVCPDHPAAKYRQEAQQWQSYGMARNEQLVEARAECERAMKRADIHGLAHGAAQAEIARLRAALEKIKLLPMGTSPGEGYFGDVDCGRCEEAKEIAEQALREEQP